MKRILLSTLVVGLMAFGGLFANTAEAHGPHGYGYGRRPGVGIATYGYGPYGGVGGYGGYSPYTTYYRGYVPYGAGYSGGWQPYQGMYYARPARSHFGLYFGF
jgi:hypothetical protein